MISSSSTTTTTTTTAIPISSSGWSDWNPVGLVVLLCVPSLLAVIYSLGAVGFVAGWGEIDLRDLVPCRKKQQVAVSAATTTCNARIVSIMVSSLSWWIAIVSMVLGDDGRHYHRRHDEFNDTTDQQPRFTMRIGVVLMGLNFLLSGVLIRQARIHIIVGPAYYDLLSHKKRATIDTRNSNSQGSEAEEEEAAQPDKDELPKPTGSGVPQKAPPPSAATATATAADNSLCSSSKRPHKIILITGANSGIGLETARWLYHRSDSHCSVTKIILACRNRQRAEQARQDILQHPNGCGGRADRSTDPNSRTTKKNRIELLSLDLTSLESIQSAVRELVQGNLLQEDESESPRLLENGDDHHHHHSTTRRQQTQKIDILINNAGLISGPECIRCEKANDVEVTMQANYLGHYYFTRLLLQANLLRGSGGEHLGENGSGKVTAVGGTCCILNVTSCTYTFVPHLPLDNESTDKDLLFHCRDRSPPKDAASATTTTATTTSYSLYHQYAASKLCNILFTYQLRRLGYTNAYAIHPGMVRTPVTKHLPWYWRYPNHAFGLLVQAFQKTPLQGAACTVTVAEQVGRTIAAARESTTEDSVGEVTSMDGKSNGWHHDTTALSGRANNHNGNRPTTTTTVARAPADTVEIANDFYFVNGRPQLLRPSGMDYIRAQRLWDVSAKLVGLPCSAP